MPLRVAPAIRPGAATYAAARARAVLRPSVETAVLGLPRDSQPAMVPDKEKGRLASKAGQFQMHARNLSRTRAPLHVHPTAEVRSRSVDQLNPDGRYAGRSIAREVGISRNHVWRLSVGASRPSYDVGAKLLALHAQVVTKAAPTIGGTRKG